MHRRQALLGSATLSTDSPWVRFAAAVRADHDQLRATQQRYHAESISSGRLLLDIVERVGFQMMVAIRLMRLAVDSDHVLLAKMVARLIRYLYAAEVHWNAQFDHGVSIVHGTGLVVSHSARIGRNCILFHGVTLGENAGPDGRIGAPDLGAGVHVGPGAVLLGPIHVGDRSKVMANVVLTESVAAGMVVRAARPGVEPRPTGRTMPGEAVLDA